MNQKKTPYLKAIIDYINEKPSRFHYPGHKGKLVTLDLTELPQTDNLFCPEGPLLEAQKLTALAFGADYSYFLVNGSTQGIQSAFLTLFKPGDKVLISYYSHRSVIEGLILSGAEPVFIEEEIDNWGIPQNITLEEIENKLDDIKGILLTNPNYFGLVPEIKEIVEYAHSKGIPVIIDEAHGIHLSFHKDLPMSGLEAGADIVIQSMHKMGLSLTQGALIHIKGNRVDSNRLEENIMLLSTTSPSTFILATIDIGRRELYLNGRKRLDRLLPMIEELKEEIERLGIPVYKKTNMDKTKLTIYKIEGNRLSFDLWEKYKIQVEMSSTTYCLFIISLLDTKRTLKKLLKALKNIDIHPSSRIDKPPRYKLIQHPRKAFFSSKEKVKVEDSTNRICGEIITQYPPGIPLLIPGALITEDIKEYLLSIGKEYINVTID
ncbi:MAG: aminotransferase class I/II-fold pyridoxal phosphate-dependent enzyme [bacterium]|nr:aminotransferase class I/II-fold pyridoxal phosphate-dependent enzyme [bacterium]